MAVPGSRWRVSALLLALSLAGCAKFMDVMESFSPPAPRPPPEPEPPYKQIIGENIRTIFSEATAINTVSVSPAQHAEAHEGSTWRVCLKANMESPNKQYNGL